MRTLLDSDAPEAARAVGLISPIASGTRSAPWRRGAGGGWTPWSLPGGIGENAAPIRAMVCERLGWLGADFDAAANAAGAPVISAPGSAVELRVIPTDEEVVIARAAARA